MSISIVRRRRCILALGTLLTGACTAPPRADSPGDWHHVTLPGKRATHYKVVHHEGRASWLADADASASLMRRRTQVTITDRTTVEFAWWVPATIPTADLRYAESADSPVRVAFAFDGDIAKLPLRDRLQFQAAEALTGEAPPYATLMYVWDNFAAPESILRGARSDRVRKIVVQSGDAKLRQWLHYRRGLKSDFVRAFGEEPGNLIGMALLTDSDNTRTKAKAWYGDIVLHP
ncbi:MAG TPA: DUF3047 domain-containing protein [Burkholderiaceae bacterium]|nr:DUF3047 domain-containing protein [Burkholderiaceae bacterium]